jgi:hypothetical protein
MINSIDSDDRLLHFRLQLGYLNLKSKAGDVTFCSH